MEGAVPSYCIKCGSRLTTHPVTAHDASCGICGEATAEASRSAAATSGFKRHPLRHRWMLGLALPTSLILGFFTACETVNPQNPWDITRIFGQGFATEPIAPGKTFPTVPSPPGLERRAVAYVTTSLVEQLAHSSNGLVRLAPGDYSIPVRLYCMGIHTPQTQHGLFYHVAPLEGSRAAVLIALMSRAPAARIPYQPLQGLIWQIGAGLSYDQLPAQSQQLVNQLIPDQKNALRENFVVSAQKSLNTVRPLFGGLPGLRDRVAQLDAMILRYQQVQVTIRQSAANYEALARQFVNIIPGLAQNAGPESWSQLNQRVYVRLSGGHVLGEKAILDIRVLPNSSQGRFSLRPGGIAPFDASGPPRRGTTAGFMLGPGGIPTTAVYDLSTQARQPQGQDNLAELPLQAVLGFPDTQNMQGLGWTIEPEAITLVANPSTVAPNNQVALSGSVIDLNGHPVRGVTVRLTAAGGQVTLGSVQTDTNGFYSCLFTAPPTPGTLTVQAGVVGTVPPIVATTTLVIQAASLDVVSYSVTAPIQKYSLPLPDGASASAFSSHTITPNPPPPPTLEFTTSDATLGAPVTLTIAVRNLGALQLTAPQTLSAMVTCPARDAQSQVPLVTATLDGQSPRSIGPNAAATLTYSVVAQWGVFWEPDASVMTTVASGAGDATQVVGDLGEVSKTFAPAGDVAGVVGVPLTLWSAATDLRQHFGIKFMPAVTFGLDLVVSSDPYTVGYAAARDLSGERQRGIDSSDSTCSMSGIRVGILAQPQQVIAAGAYWWWQLSKIGVEALPIPSFLTGPVANYLSAAQQCINPTAPPAYCQIYQSQPPEQWFLTAATTPQNPRVAYTSPTATEGGYTTAPPGTILPPIGLPSSP